MARAHLLLLLRPLPRSPCPSSPSSAPHRQRTAFDIPTMLGTGESRGIGGVEKRGADERSRTSIETALASRSISHLLDLNLISLFFQVLLL